VAPPEGWALPEQGGPLDGAAAALSPNELLNQLLGFCGGGAAGAAGAAPRPGGAAGRGGHPAAAAGPAPGLPLGGGTPTALAGVKGTLGDSDVSTLSGCSGPGVSAARGRPACCAVRLPLPLKLCVQAQRGCACARSWAVACALRCPRCGCQAIAPMHAYASLVVLRVRGVYLG